MLLINREMDTLTRDCCTITKDCGMESKHLTKSHHHALDLDRMTPKQTGLESPLVW